MIMINEELETEEIRNALENPDTGPSRKVRDYLLLSRLTHTSLTTIVAMAKEATKDVNRVFDETYSPRPRPVTNEEKKDEE